MCHAAQVVEQQVKVHARLLWLGEIFFKASTSSPDIWVKVFTRPAADAGIKKRLQPVASDIKYYSWLILSA